MDIDKAVLVLHLHWSLPPTSFPHSLQTCPTKTPSFSTSCVQVHLHIDHTQLSSINMLSVTAYKDFALTIHSVLFSLFCFLIPVLVFWFLKLSCQVYPFYWLSSFLLVFWPWFRGVSLDLLIKEKKCNCACFCSLLQCLTTGKYVMMQ